jgi:carboxypeptidase E
MCATTDTALTKTIAAVVTKNKVHPAGVVPEHRFPLFPRWLFARSIRYGGITNGFAWYQIFGSRMDYITPLKIRGEVTIEVSTTKNLSGSELPNYWKWNYKSLLQLIEQSLFGINGTVVDSITPKGLWAKISVNNHNVDADTFFTMSKLPFGDYYRSIAQGTWSVTYACDG